MSSTSTATALAHPNIAFIKYWGNRNDALRLPTNASLSMNLAGLETRTSVQFDHSLAVDVFHLNGVPQSGPPLQRLIAFLDLVREQAGIRTAAVVTSENSFPTGAGIASSASAFAALALAASAAAGLELDERALSRLARRGSGSASRSVPGGFVEWFASDDPSNSYAQSFAPPDYWDLCDCVAIVSAAEKQVSSTSGHHLAGTSPFQAARVADTPRRFAICRQAILEHNFPAFAEILEEDSLQMHAVMMTSHPPLFYWQPASLHLLHQVREWRHAGLPCASTMDAGPNVHVLCPSSAAEEVKHRLLAVEGVLDVRMATPGGPARLC